MQNLYYKIWVDGLLKLKSRPENSGMWKFYGMIFISMAMALNIAVFMAIIQRNILQTTFYEISVDIFPGTKLDSLVSFVILYMIPPVIINYFFIFRNNRYEMLFKKYRSYDGKVCIVYLMISYFLPFLLLLLSHFINNL